MGLMIILNTILFIRIKFNLKLLPSIALIKQFLMMKCRSDNSHRSAVRKDYYSAESDFKPTKWHAVIFIVYVLSL